MREETRSSDGTVMGRYGYTDPFGIFRIVQYIAGPQGYYATEDIAGSSSSSLLFKATARQIEGVNDSGFGRIKNFATQFNPPLYHPEAHLAERPQNKDEDSLIGMTSFESVVLKKPLILNLVEKLKISNEKPLKSNENIKSTSHVSAQKIINNSDNFTQNYFAQNKTAQTEAKTEPKINKVNQSINNLIVKNVNVSQGDSFKKSYQFDEEKLIYSVVKTSQDFSTTTITSTSIETESNNSTGTTIFPGNFLIKSVVTSVSIMKDAKEDLSSDKNCTKESGTQNQVANSKKNWDLFLPIDSPKFRSGLRSESLTLEMNQTNYKIRTKPNDDSKKGNQHLINETFKAPRLLIGISAKATEVKQNQPVDTLSTLMSEIKSLPIEYASQINSEFSQNLQTAKIESKSNERSTSLVPEIIANQEYNQEYIPPILMSPQPIADVKKIENHQDTKQFITQSVVGKKSNYLFPLVHHTSFSDDELLYTDGNERIEFKINDQAKFQKQDINKKTYVPPINIYSAEI